MKKAISLLMAGGMMMSLAACGGSAAASSDNAANTTTSTETASTAADSGEKITLHCMMSLGQWADHIDELTAAYEAEHPNVTLEWELTSSSTGSDLLKSKLAADELPDVFDVNYGESTVQWAPHLLNVDDLVEPLKEGGIPDSAIDAGYYEGEFYHVPLTTEGYGILYNMNYLN